MPQAGSVSVPEGKWLNGKSVRTSPLHEDRSATEQRREGSSSFDIRSGTSNTAASNSNQGARPKEVFSASSGRTDLQG